MPLVAKSVGSGRLGTYHSMRSPNLPACRSASSSQIERGIVSPSIRSLRQLSKALGVPVSWFFQTRTARFDEGSGPGGARLAPAPAVVDEAGGVKEVVPTPPSVYKACRCFVITLEPQFVDQLGARLGSRAKNAASSCSAPRSSLSRIGAPLLWEGDSFGFDSSRPHLVRNTGPGVTRVLWITTPPSTEDRMDAGGGLHEVRGESRVFEKDQFGGHFSLTIKFLPR